MTTLLVVGRTTRNENWTEGGKERETERGKEKKVRKLGESFSAVFLNV